MNIRKTLREYSLQNGSWATTYTANDFKLCTVIVFEFNRRSEPPIALKLAAS
jgi:hypothetical protein